MRILNVVLAGSLFMSLTIDAVAAVQKAVYGKTADGKNVDVYTLSSPELQVKIITYGARIIAIDTPDKTGKRDNVVLGYKDLAGYASDSAYFGATVGRFANRIAKGTFSIEGKTYHTPINNGVNTLHGGPKGFAQAVWTGKEIANGVEMTLVSPDGEMGFPGTVTVQARYTVDGSSLKLDLSATTDKPTVLNLTNHSYFNLSGEGNGTILGDMVQIDANTYVPVNTSQIPTGQLASVAGTPFDFRTPHAVGERIDTPGNEQLKIGGGYDHTWVVNGKAGTLREAAKVIDPQSGRTLTVSTTQPGVQFYAGNSLTGKDAGSNGKTIAHRGGLALETQYFPDAPNQPNFPSSLLKPGQTLHETTVFTFGVAKSPVR